MSSEVADRLRAMIPDRLRAIAGQMDKEAALSARAGQMDRIEEMAVAVRQIAHELDGKGHFVARASELRGEGKDGDA